MLIYLRNKNKWMWCFALAIALPLCAILLFLIFYKIEQTVDGFVRIDNLDSSNLFIESQNGYKFKMGDNITFKVGQKYYHSTIKGIYYDETAKKLCLNILKIDFHFPPGSIIPMSVITSYDSVLSSIIGSV